MTNRPRPKRQPISPRPPLIDAAPVLAKVTNPQASALMTVSAEVPERGLKPGRSSQDAVVEVWLEELAEVVTAILTRRSPRDDHGIRPDEEDRHEGR